jgi:lipopolysaccharide/colanic/teichoic acid biosynthesis glycosyltransferase
MYINRHLRDTPSEQMGITLLYGGFILAIAIALLLRSRQYSITKRLDSLSSIGYLLRDTGMAAAITALVSYATKGFFTGHTTPSRLAVGIVILTFFFWGTLARVVLGALQRRQYATGRGARRILIAGGGKAAAELLQLIVDRPQLGVVVMGKLRLDIPEWPRRETATVSSAGKTPEADERDPLELSAEFWPTLVVSDDLEGLRQLDQLLRTTQATEVIVALDPEAQGAVPRLADFLSLAHVPFRVVPSLFEDTFRAGELLGHSSIPVVDLAVSPLDRVGRIAKRAMDVCIATFVLVTLFPVWFPVGLAILAESGFPVIFAQERVGKNGRRFTLYKFRTMVKDAEAKLEDLEAQNELAASDGCMFKMRKDPRVTRVGNMLRKCSLDELPQFVNVLKGDMSVVGPRPPLPREVTKYERDHLYRLRALPGITGLWQVSGRNELSFEEMVTLDRYYVDNWSLRMDVRIMFKTFGALVSRKGAY